MTRPLIASFAVFAISFGCAAHPQARPQPGPVAIATSQPVVPPRYIAKVDHARFGAVATVDPIATDAALRTLKSGGNAVDASVAAMLTLGVVDPYNSGIGGGCFMLIRMADGRTFALDGREMAPAAATRDMFIRAGRADPRLSQVGALAVGIPGSLAVYEFATRQLGHKPLADLLIPAAQLAADGFVVDSSMTSRIHSATYAISPSDSGYWVLTKPDGALVDVGDRLVQRDLAKTYRLIAREGIGYFYKGEFARVVGDWMHAHGGIVTADDFAHYEMVQREPLKTSYHGHTLLGFPPPSSGGLHVAQILGMLERFDLETMSDADRTTAIANAMDLAFADRAFWLGDPDFAHVPRGLIDPAYLATQSQRITPTRALEHPYHGNPSNADTDFFQRQQAKHTTHVSVADAEGNVVSVTATINTTFGSKVVVPGTGVFLNNQMDDFSAQPGVPNAFKLVGAEANAIGPLKRPLSSMSPTIVLDASGKPEIVVGAAGGPTIITQVVCVLSNLMDLKLPPREAMERARIHHQWTPDELKIENNADAATREALRARGFTLTEVAPAGATNLVVIDGSSMTAVSEPRLPSKAAAE